MARGIPESVCVAWFPVFSTRHVSVRCKCRVVLFRECVLSSRLFPKKHVGTVDGKPEREGVSNGPMLAVSTKRWLIK